MKFSPLTFGSLLAVTLFSKVRGAPSPNGNACLVEYFKENGKLDQSYPTPPGYDQRICAFIMTFTIAVVQTLYVEKLTEEDKVECIKEQWTKRDLVEYMIVQGLLEDATHIKLEEQKTQINAARTKQRKIMKQTARKCQSDLRYGGAFDEILGLDISSPAALEAHFCFTKYVTENGFIDLKNINGNPQHIETANIDCEVIINDQKTKLRSQFEEKLKKNKASTSKRNCVLGLFDTQKAFELELTTKVLALIKISPADKSRNRGAVQERLQNYVMQTMSCA